MRVSRHITAVPIPVMLRFRESLCHRLIVLFSSLLAVSLMSRTVSAADVHAAPSVDETRKLVLDWVASRQITDQTTLRKIGSLWAKDDTSPDASELLDRVVQTFGLVDRTTQTFVEACRWVDAPLIPPGTEWLEKNDDPFFSANMRLFYGRYLCHRRMYEMALGVLTPVQVADVVDPASYFFFRAVCEQKLLKKTDGLKSLRELLENTQDVPPRYTAVAKLMQLDMQAWQEESLDGIARKMSDAERRLDLGRGGPKVQKVEDDIVAALDKLIDDLEKKQQQAQNAQAGNAQSNQLLKPAQDSRVKGTTAPGEVDKKNIGNKGGWGALPPKQAVRAKNLINRNFPVHYRRAVEEYFRKLAKRHASQGESVP